MPKIYGKNGSVTIGANTVANLANIAITFTGAPVGGRAFGERFQEVVGVGDEGWSAEVSGYLDKTDVNGQTILENAIKNGTILDGTNNVRCYIDPTTYYEPDTDTFADAGCFVTGQGVGIVENEVVSVSFTLTFSGPWRRVG